MICLGQVDLKSLVAYSSVSHMGMLVGGLMSFSFAGLKGGILMLVTHGLTSSCMFLVLFLFYCRGFSRSVFSIKSLLWLNPLLGLWWFLLISLNMGVPPSLGFFSEILVLMGVLSV